MYIKYELYRSKTGEMFNTEKIEWVIQDNRDLVDIDNRINQVLATHISQLPEVKKYGTAYIGRMKLVSIEINDNDELGGLDEQGFRSYMANSEVMPLLTIEWNKTTNNTTKKKKSVKTKPEENKEEQNG